jgi:hypothetical protein
MTVKARPLSLLAALALALGGLWAAAPAVQADEELPSATLNNLVVAGEPRVGDAVYADYRYLPLEAEFAYQWLRDGVDIDGATDRVYYPAVADLGAELSVRMTVSAEGYTSVTKTSEPVTIGRGEITFTGVAVGQTDGVFATGRAVYVNWEWLDAGSELAVQWLRDGVAIEGATNTSYVLQPADVGHAVNFTVTASKDGYNDKTVTAAAVTPSLGTLTITKVELLSAAHVGDRLTAGRSVSYLPSAGTPAYAWQWNLDGVPIAGATSEEYTVTADDLGHVLSVTLTATLDGYAPATATSAGVTVEPQRTLSDVLNTMFGRIRAFMQHLVDVIG